MSQVRSQEISKAVAPLTAAERAEMQRLGRRWATGRATVKQMERFRSLERRDKPGRPCRQWPKCACIQRGREKRDCVPAFAGLL